MNYTKSWMLIIVNLVFSTLGKTSKSFTEDFQSDRSQISYVSTLVPFPSLPDSYEVNTPTINSMESIRLDLHKLSVSKAKETTLSIIKKAHGIGVHDVYIITGRGKHINSSGNRGILKRSLPLWLNDVEIAPLIKSIKIELGATQVILSYISQKNYPLICQIESKTLYSLAEQNIPEAQYYLGKRLLETNDNKAIHWLEKAAGYSDLEAMSLLGYAYIMGKGARYNPKNAMYWYKKAANLNHKLACLNLGIMFWSGVGCTVNIKEAKSWFKKAAFQENIFAERYLGIIYFRAKNYEKAAQWNHRAVAHSDSHAKVNLGDMYLLGLGVSQDIPKSLELFEQAGQSGVARGWLRLGTFYLNRTENTEKDCKKAAKFLLTAALATNDQHGAEAQYFLSKMYFNGQGFRKDMQIANTWLYKAAHNGNPEAQFDVGMQCDSHEEGLTWFKKADQAGLLKATYRIFEIYFFWGYENNIQTSKRKYYIKQQNHYLKKATQAGYSMALIHYGIIPDELRAIVNSCENSDSSDTDLISESKYNDEDFLSCESSLSEGDDVFFTPENFSDQEDS